MAPSPLWAERSSWMRLPMQNQQKSPVILRFANDMFIDEMIAMLTHSPWRFNEWVAQYETWRKPMPNPQPIEISRPTVSLPDLYNKTNRLVQNYPRTARLARIKSLVKTPATVPQSSPDKTLRLYHANHQRYYVVTASLVSEEKGYPDYLLNLGHDERATFVVRALVENENNTCDEYGFVSTSSGKAWRKVGMHGMESTAVLRVISNEERLPLFPVTYPDGCGRFRRLFGGLIPVGKRDEWLDAPEFNSSTTAEVEIASPVPANDGGLDHYKEILYSDVIAPWKALIDRAETDKRKNDVKDSSFPNFQFNADNVLLDKIRNVRTARDEIQTSSWYVLHDFAQFLQDHLPNVWKELNAFVNPQEAGSIVLSDIEEELFNVLVNTKMDTRLFIELAMENLAVGGFVSATGVSLWDRLLDFWKLEIYLKLSTALYVSGNYLSDLREQLISIRNMSRTMLHSVNLPEMSPLISDARLALIFAESNLQFISEFQSQSNRTFLEFAKWLRIRYPEMKSAALKGVAPSSQADAGRFFNILQKIKIPMIQGSVLSAIEGEISGTTEIKKSIEIKKTMWEILSFYWKFEDYVSATVEEDVFDTVINALHSEQQLDVSDLKNQILNWFYDQGTTRGEWYSFIQFADDLEKLCPSLHAAAMLEIFDKTIVTDKQTDDLITILKKAEIKTAIHDVLSYPNPDLRTIRIIPFLSEALVEVSKCTDVLENVNTPYDRSLMADKDVTGKVTWWPDFLFPLTDPGLSFVSLTDSSLLPSLEQSHIVPVLSKGSAPATDVENLKSRLDEFAIQINNLVPKESLGDARSSILSLEPLLTQKDPRFVVRFVFERPQCGSLLFPPLVSEATCPFEMALFMDPDAPARTVHVHMPLDISPAGLRKYKKNAMFLFSDVMCGKMKKIKKLTLADLVLSVLPWPFHKDLPDVGSSEGPCDSGLICSLSIPIVTLCAMILLFIMVSLFEMIFKWMPWFFVCFPVPGMPNLKVKKDE